MAIRFSQVPSELVITDSSRIRVSQLATEIVIEADPDIRVTQAALEVISTPTGTPTVDVSNAIAEVVYQITGPPEVRISNVLAEIVYQSLPEVIGNIPIFPEPEATTGENTKYFYTTTAEFFPDPEAATRTNNRGSYTGGISVYPEPEATTRSNCRGRYVGVISCYLQPESTTKGRHIWLPSIEVPIFPRNIAASYNYISIPEGTSSSPGTIDIEVPMDVIDFGLQSNHLGGMGATEFFRSMHIIDTDDYDGTCTWRYQVIAKNSSEYDRTFTLKRIYGLEWDPDSYSTEDVLEVIIPASTIEYTLFEREFTPTDGFHRYYWSIPDDLNCALITGRPVVTQLGATKTIIWRPLCNRGGVWHFNDHMGISWGSPDSWQNSAYVGTFYWQPDLYVGNVSIVLEATLGSSYKGVVSGFRLYDITDDMGVPGTSFTVTSGGAFRYPQSWVERHEFSASLLTEDHLYKMQFRREGSWGGGITTDWLSSTLLGRAAFMIRIDQIETAEVLWRIAKQAGGPVTNSIGSARARVRGRVGNNSEITYLKNETCSIADFYWASDPVVDFWVTDDDHRISGDGGSAINILESNARQEPVDELLPIFSYATPDYFSPDTMFCMRSQPVSVGGDANSQWTLVCIGYHISAYEYCICPTIHGFLAVAEPPQMARCDVLPSPDALLTDAALIGKITPAVKFRQVHDRAGRDPHRRPPGL